MANKVTDLSDDTSSLGISRKAINAFGTVGSLYDSCRDCLLIEGNKNIPKKSFNSSRPAKCTIIPGNAKGSQNLLRTIDTEIDLRLSLLLNLTKRIGLASVLNYSHEINEGTRFLYFSWSARQEEISIEDLLHIKPIDLNKSKFPATHIITGVNYGVDMVIVVQLPSDNNSIIDIDNILEKISKALSNGDNLISLLTTEENERLRRITNLTVYSNISDLSAYDNIASLLHQVQILKLNASFCPPINYSLHSLAVIYPQYMNDDVIFNELPSELARHLEEHILQQRSAIFYLRRSFQHNKQKYFKGYLERIYDSAYKQYLRLNSNYQLDMEQLSKLLKRFRYGQIESFVIKDELSKRQKNTTIHELAQNVYELEKKAHLINDLINQNFIYCNAIDYDINNFDNESTIKNKLIGTSYNYRIICSSDAINESNPEKYIRLRSLLTKEHQQDPKLHIIYADFSYSSYKLRDTCILSSNDHDEYTTRPVQKPLRLYTESSPSTDIHRQEQTSQPPPKHIPNPKNLQSTPEAINILLLGETGVGKSTFINALVNYLAFSTFEEAQDQKPIINIPGTSRIQTGNNFKDYTVQYGDVENTMDEDVTHPGQSATQHCKCYILRLKHNTTNQPIRMHVIDTPGFGDNRGLDQNDQNMEHILQYIQSLTHLNAICFLLRSDATRLNVFFRTCFTQLFSLLSPTARQNTIFCFTHTRSTFYTPGTAALLVKKMLADPSMNDIPFTNENTFCFDNESFRYMIGLHDGISFTHEQKQEYKKSWLKSVEETTRFIDYICSIRTPCYLRSENQSIKNIQFEIFHIIRPILETIRNILRNIILIKMNLSQTSIELLPQPIDRPTAFCFSCKNFIVNIGSFWILSNVPHECLNKCYTCSCPAETHVPVDYLLEYQIINKSQPYDINELYNILHEIYFTSAQISHFLIHGAQYSKDDLILLGLKQMINEENDICEQEENNQMNMALIKELTKAQHDYERQMHDVTSKQSTKALPHIHEQVERILMYPYIREQVHATQKGLQTLSKRAEIDI